MPDRVATPWTAEFSTDGGQTWTTEKPEWLTAFTSEGAGGYASTNYAATVAAQQAVTANPHNDMLQAATPVVGTYDLSTKGGTTAMNTANCYIINARDDTRCRWFMAMPSRTERPTAALISRMLPALVY